MVLKSVQQQNEKTEDSGLTEEELRQKLFVYLEHTVGNQLKSSLRGNLIERLHNHGVQLSKPSPPTDLLSRAMDSLVLEHLRHSKYISSESVFSAECGIGTSPFTMPDILQVLHINKLTKGGQQPSPLTVDTTEQILIDRRTPLTHVVTTLVWLSCQACVKATSVASKAVQAGIAEGPTLEERFHLIEETYRSRLHQANRPSIEDTIRKYKEEIDRRTVEEIRREVERLKETEISKMRLEEEFKYRNQVAEKLREFESMEAERRHQFQLEKWNLEQRAQELELNMTEVHKQKSHLSQHIELREQQIKSLQQELRDAREQCQRLERTNSFLQDEVVSYQHRNENLGQEKKRILVELECLKRTQEHEKQQVEVEIKKKRHEVEEWHKELMDEQMKLELARKKELVVRQQHLAELEADTLQKLEKEHERLRMDADFKVQQKLRELQNDYREKEISLEKQNSELQRQKDTAILEISKKENELNVRQHTLDAREQQLAAQLQGAGIPGEVITQSTIQQHVASTMLGWGGGGGGGAAGAGGGGGAGARSGGTSAAPPIYPNISKVRKLSVTRQSIDSHSVSSKGGGGRGLDIKIPKKRNKVERHQYENDGELSKLKQQFKKAEQERQNFNQEEVKKALLYEIEIAGESRHSSSGGSNGAHTREAPTSQQYAAGGSTTTHSNGHTTAHTTTTTTASTRTHQLLHTTSSKFVPIESPSYPLVRPKSFPTQGEQTTQQRQQQPHIADGTVVPTTTTGSSSSNTAHSTAGTTTTAPATVVATATTITRRSPSPPTSHSTHHSDPFTTTDAVISKTPSKTKPSKQYPITPPPNRTSISPDQMDTGREIAGVSHAGLSVEIDLTTQQVSQSQHNQRYFPPYGSSTDIDHDVHSDNDVDISDDKDPTSEEHLKVNEEEIKENLKKQQDAFLELCRNVEADEEQRRTELLSVWETWVENEPQRFNKELQLHKEQEHQLESAMHELHDDESLQRDLLEETQQDKWSGLMFEWQEGLQEARKLEEQRQHELKMQEANEQHRKLLDDLEDREDEQRFTYEDLWVEGIQELEKELAVIQDRLAEEQAEKEAEEQERARLQQLHDELEDNMYALEDMEGNTRRSRQNSTWKEYLQLYSTFEETIGTLKEEWQAKDEDDRVRARLVEEARIEREKSEEAQRSQERPEEEDSTEVGNPVGSDSDDLVMTSQNNDEDNFWIKPDEADDDDW